MTHNNPEERNVEDWEREFEVQFTWLLDGANDDIKNFIHHQLQKARQNWLREEIVKLEGMQSKQKVNNGHECYDPFCNYCENGIKDQALQTIIDRYSAELDQDVSKWSQCNNCFDGQHDKCIGRNYGCECKHQANPLPTQVTE